MPDLVYSIDEWSSMHGGPLLRVEGFGDFRLLEDGARVMRNWTDHKEPIQFPPPTDEFECLQIRRAYWKERVRRVEAAFAQLKRTFVGESFNGIDWQPCWGDPPTGDNVSQLKALAAAVRRERRKMKKVQDECDANPTAIANRKTLQQREQAEQERAEAERQYQQSVDKITI